MQRKQCSSSCFSSVDEDYELNFQMALDILESTGNQICVNVDIIDDELVEGMEEFGLSLSSSDQVVAFIIQTAVVVIEDNDCEYNHKFCLCLYALSYNLQK